METFFLNWWFIMNRWKRFFWITFIVSIGIYGIIIPSIFDGTPPNIYYSNLIHEYKLINSDLAENIPDYSLDSDYDGLSDYEEINKYLTDPYNSDSDRDGIKDGEWDERYQYTRVFRAVVDLRKPYNLEHMNDFYQDARLVEVVSDEVSRFEIILYPDAKEVLIPTQFIPKDNEFTKPTYSKNYNSEMISTYNGIVESAKSDLHALVLLQRSFNKLNYISLKNDLGFTTTLPLQFQIYRNEEGQLIKKYYGYPTTHSIEELNDRLFYADGMFRNGTRGACSSSATIRGAMFRSVGLEERTVFTIPLFYSTDSDGTRVDVENIPLNNSLNLSSGNVPISDHFFNIVKIGERWIRVDTNIIDTGIYAPYIKLLEMDDQVDYSWEIWNFETYYDKRPYKYISIEELSNTEE